MLNDITCRDWQFRTRDWLQGKTWDSTTPVGPHLVTPDELPGGVRPALDIRCAVDGAVMQSDTTADLLFDPVAPVEDVSTTVWLNPSDLIATGTTGGDGHARRPEVYLQPGQTWSPRSSGLRICCSPSPVGGAGRDHGVSELARAVGRERSQVSRMLRALERGGLVDQDPETRRYRLGWSLLVLAAGAGGRPWDVLTADFGYSRLA